jgi:hypothetical protein
MPRQWLTVSYEQTFDGRPVEELGGLNDATRNQEFSVGTAPSDYTFEASLVRKKCPSIYLSTWSTPYFVRNHTNYTLRMMATYASGTSNSGWSYVLSVGSAMQGVFDGTNWWYSFFASVEKVDDKHSINISGFYTCTEEKTHPIWGNSINLPNV